MQIIGRTSATHGPAWTNCCRPGLHCCRSLILTLNTVHIDASSLMLPLYCFDMQLCRQYSRSSSSLAAPLLCQVTCSCRVPIAVALYSALGYNNRPQRLPHLAALFLAHSMQQKPMKWRLDSCTECVNLHSVPEARRLIGSWASKLCIACQRAADQQAWQSNVKGVIRGVTVGLEGLTAQVHVHVQC